MKLIHTILAAVLIPAFTVLASPISDPDLEKARKFVESSDRYLHHSHLKRGMKGYGLTVFAGTRIEKFDARIVSVVKNFNPGQDVILAMLDEQKLKNSKIIAGMSGSPVFMKDPADGKFKMIGAVAYGWGMSTEPLGGIQPITQMLAVSGILDEAKARESREKKGGGKRKKGRRKKSARKDIQPVIHDNFSSQIDINNYLKMVLSPEKKDFAVMFSAKPPQLRGGFRPLSVPLSVSSASPLLMEQLTEHFSGSGLIPLAGGAAGGNKPDLQNVKLRPGSCLCIPMVTGDLDMSAIGTTTEVIGNRILGFGHSMMGAGNIRMPMGTGYIHSVIARLDRSFKMGSAIREVGTLNRDEEVAVGGTIGPKVPMIPMTVEMFQVEDGRKQTFNYRIIDHWMYTSRMCSSALRYSLTALRQPPEFYHLRYRIRVEYEKLGIYEVENISGGGFMGLYAASSDMTRPISGLLSNPFSKPISPKKIHVSVRIYKGDIMGDIIDAKLDEKIYRPGDTVTGSILMERFRKKRATMKFSVKLPGDLKEGNYSLTVGDMFTALSFKQSEEAYKYTPRTPRQIMDAMKLVVKPRQDLLYTHIPLHGRGVAMGQKTLPDLPVSKAVVILGASVPDTTIFSRSQITSIKTPYVINGSRRLQLIIREQTNETPLR